MTEEGIHYLARVYAESVNPVESYGDDIVEREMDVRIECDTAIPVLQWLLERYCIVEKNEIKEWVNTLTEVAPYPENVAIMIGAERLFGKEPFKNK